MSKSFIIAYNGKQVPVATPDGKEFTLRLQENDMIIVHKEDDEGASHWFEKGTDNETARSKEIGLLIEAGSKTANSN